MFGLFKKKSEIDKLYDQYEKLTKQAHSLSHQDRTAGDAKLAEAEEVMKKIEALENKAK
jgi:uncharacterized protein Yka (UPF0111/DUF47 family)